MLWERGRTRGASASFASTRRTGGPTILGVWPCHVCGVQTRCFGMIILLSCCDAVELSTVCLETSRGILDF